MEQLSNLQEIRYRAMMGEYILYYRGKIAAYLCDNRLLVKPVPSALTLLPNARYESPYPGAKEMLLVEEVENHAFLQVLFLAIYLELPQPKKKAIRKHQRTFS